MSGNKEETLEPEIDTLDTVPVDGDCQSDVQDVDNILKEIETIDALKQEIEAEKDRYLRLMAEFDNFKRRTAKEYERLVESASEKLMLEIVDVRENFERALKAGEAGGDLSSFIEGMKLIFAKFEETLSRNGLAVFAEIGEAFDPTIHDALMNTPHPEIPVEHIAEVFERGYRLKDKVVKHARVIVSSGPPEAAGE
ncbi:MAG: nucleotide exchange factor GrpE [Chitinispirillales bacterium]|jgi:molecular chaperone GrpE|nr:nucleotide exchange factor GrpE [Chitinispirillales bacterium]